MIYIYVFLSIYHERTRGAVECAQGIPCNCIFYGNVSRSSYDNYEENEIDVGMSNISFIDSGKIERFDYRIQINMQVITSD